MYFLETRRLGFSCWTAVDFALAHLLWGDPQVMRLVGGAYTLEQSRARLHKELEWQREYGFQYWPIFLLEGERFVGCCGLRPYRPKDRIYELGVHLRPEYWCKGLAQEACAAVVERAFGEVGASELFAGHHPENGASGALLRRLGFERTGEQFYEPTGLLHPSYRLRRSSAATV